MTKPPPAHDAQHDPAATSGAALRERSERLRVLNSAWSVLAPFTLAAETQHIVETGRALAAEIADLAGRAPDGRDPAALRGLDKMLDAVDAEIRALAFQVPVAQLRSTLPSRLSRERRGVLDLLDLMLVAELDRQEGAAGRISAIDYLITLLCTGGPGGDGSVRDDPVGLTPRLYSLCERAAERDEPVLAAIEAEFYAAANVSELDAREELQIRALRRRKRDLGLHFFAPGVLRAIVAYNAAMSRCLQRGAWDSRDWGTLAGAEGSAAATGDEGGSVFETEALPRLAEALRRRTEGEAASGSAVDRIAWCLDLASLGEVERGALLGADVGREADLEGTAMLVGLLCRSAVVLEEELPAIGIAPSLLTGGWTRELDDALKREINGRIADNAYDAARSLTELRNTLLYSLMTPDHRGAPAIRRPVDPEPFVEVEREARELAEEAASDAAETVGTAPGWRALPWGAFARLAGAALLVAMLVGAGASWFLRGEVGRMNGAALDDVSPYLARGGRNGDGAGPAFVGTLDPSWAQLASEEQADAAHRLVAALRAQGVQQVMVYDGAGRLRVQALGQQPARVFDPPAP